MDATLQAEKGSPPAASENTDVAGENGGLSSADVVQRFAKRMLEKSKPAKAEPAEEAPADETTEETPIEATAEDTATKTQPDTEAEAPDDDAEVLSQFPVKAQEKINKRISEITAEKKTAEERAAAAEARAKELEAKLNAVPDTTPAQTTESNTPSSGGDLAGNIHDEAGLVKLGNDARNALKWVEDNGHLVIKAIANDQSSIEIDGKEYSVDDIKAIQRTATDTLSRAIPARQAFLQQRQTFVAQARQKFPDFFDRSKPDYQQIEQVRRQIPQITSIPNHELLLGYALRGLKAEAAEQEAAAKAKQAKPAEAKPPSLGDAGAVAPKPKAAMGANATLKREVEEARKAFESSGSMQDRIHLERLKQRLKAAH